MVQNGFSFRMAWKESGNKWEKLRQMVRTARLMNINTFVNFPDLILKERKREIQRERERERFGIYLENLLAFHKDL